MKKIILTSVFVLVAVAASAQLNVRAGYANSTWHDDGSRGTNYNGASVGVGYDIKLNSSGSFMLSPGLRYTFATGKDNDSVRIEESYSDHAVALPVHVKFALPLSDDFKFYLFAGPNVSYGIAYRSKMEFTADPDIESPVIYNPDGYVTRDFYKGSEWFETSLDNEGFVAEIVNNSPHLNRFDVAASGGIGIQWRHLFLEAGYNFGLLNRSKRDDTWKHDQLNIAVGYSF